MQKDVDKQTRMWYNNATSASGLFCCARERLPTKSASGTAASEGGTRTGDEILVPVQSKF